MHIIYRKTCRVCGSSALTPVIDLGEQYLQGSFIKPGKEMPVLRKIPTSLVRCDPTLDEKACGLLQMSCTLPPEILYSAYWYRSGTNQTMRDHLQGIVNDAVRLMPSGSHRILDIGCNDGTLLRSCPADWVKFGIDPSDVAQEIPDDIRVVQGLFPSPELLRLTAGKPFDVIASIAMFYDLESPVEFARSIKRHLSPNGVWIFEMSYMPRMLELGSYDTICHEHLEYYSLAVIEHILLHADLRLFDVALNDINGGSIRCFATHRDNFEFKSDAGLAHIRALRNKEFELELDLNRPYHEFQQRIQSNRQQLRSLLLKLKAEGKSIHVYGASTKGNTILQFCGLDHTILDCAADRNRDKHGARTLGTNIPIISEEESRARKPDYYLVLPWHFKHEFLQREKMTIQNGTHMIFPIPEIEIVSHAGTSTAFSARMG